MPLMSPICDAVMWRLRSVNAPETELRLRCSLYFGHPCGMFSTSVSRTLAANVTLYLKQITEYC